MKEILKAAAVWAAIICIIPAAAGMKAGQETLATTAASDREEKTLRLETDMLSVTGKSGEEWEISIEEYTVYALLAQIPEPLSKEAMKAQAAAARTYAVRRIMSGEGITFDPEKSQIYLTEEEAREMYGAEYEAALESARQAAEETRGQVIVYKGSPIIAAFHTSSAGMTESAENVWGKEEPYLSAVPSEGDIYSPYYGRERAFTYAEISARISAEYSDSVPFEEIETDITPSGTVTAVTLCGVTVSGSRLAEILSLDSAAFTVRTEDGQVIFTVNGCGHLAGMSIYGAEYMARNGSDYKEILSHYYIGTELASVT